jgi:hypothetical protein
MNCIDAANINLCLPFSIQSIYMFGTFYYFQGDSCRIASRLNGNYNTGHYYHHTDKILR